MARKKSANGQRRRRQSGAVSPWAVLLVVIVAGAAAFLSWQAIRGPAGEAGALPTKPGAPAELPEPAVEPEPAPQSAEYEEIVHYPLAAPTRLLAAVNELVVVRGEVGTCAEPGRIEISTDGGAGWTDAPGIVELGAAEMLRILPTSTDAIYVIARNEECIPAMYFTPDQGATWSLQGDPAGSWYLDSPVTASTPLGLRDLPCEAVSMAAEGDRAALLCSDETLLWTADQSETWSEPVAAPGAVTVGVGSDGTYLVALANTIECPGIRTAVLSGADLGQARGCIAADLNSGGVPGGLVAVTSAGSTAFAWVADHFAVSGDGGATW